MSIRDIRNIVSCSIGALLLVSLGYFIFNNPPSIKLTPDGILDMVEAVSWQVIACIVCFAVLCMECLLVKYKANSTVVQKLLICIAVLMAASGIFAAFAYASNPALFNEYAFGFIVVGIGASAFMTLLIYQWNKIDKVEKLLLLGAAILAIVGMCAIINSYNALQKNDAVSNVVNKYYQQFNTMGFTDIDFYSSYDDSGVKYHKKRTSGDKRFFISDREVKEALNIQENKYDYDNKYYNKYTDIRLFVKQGKLYIEHIDYNAKKISNEQLAQELDVIMEKVIMPKLQNLNTLLLQEEQNQLSYQ